MPPGVRRCKSHAAVCNGPSLREHIREVDLATLSPECTQAVLEMPSAVRSTLVLSAVTLAVTSGVTACSARVETGLFADSSFQTVTLSPPGPVNMNLGAKVIFSAIVRGVPGASSTVTWSSANPRIATVDQAGIVTADSVGATTIIATLNANTGVSAAAIVAVGAPASAARIP